MVSTPHAQFLSYINSVLSQTGQDSVPYNENVKWTIREHLSELTKIFSTLVVQVSDFHGNDGRTQHLLKCEGTIPIHYNNIKYNIPIAIWLLEKYPYVAPLVYVVPTANMIIKSPHRFVDRNGQVTSPAIQRWLFPSSNLVDLTLEMAHIFGSDPPVYSQPGTSRPPPAAAAVPAPMPPAFTVQPPAGYPTYSNPINQQAGAGPSPPSFNAPSPGSFNAPAGPSPQQPYNPAANPIWGAVYAATQPTPPPPAPPAQQQSSALPIQEPAPSTSKPEVTREELESGFRDVAVEAICRRLMADLVMGSNACGEEMVGLLEEQRTLESRRSQLEGIRASLDKERAGTETLVRDLGSTAAALKTWLERNEPKAAALQASGKPVSAGAAFAPTDPVAAKVLQAHSEDLAVEDTILALDKALQSGVLPLEVYIKQVRALGRKQFFARALSQKFSQAQPTQPVEPPPQRLQPYPPPLTWVPPPPAPVMLTNPLSGR